MSADIVAFVCFILGLISGALYVKYPGRSSAKVEPTMRTHTPPPMPAVRPALLDVKEARKAIERAEAAWNTTQMEDALRSAEFFIAEARTALKANPVAMPNPGTIA